MWIILFFCRADGNVNQLLPLVEEYQILAVKKKCEEFLLTKTGSMELLITGIFACLQLVIINMSFVYCQKFQRCKSYISTGILLKYALICANLWYTPNFTKYHTHSHTLEKVLSMFEHLNVAIYDVKRNFYDVHNWRSNISLDCSNSGPMHVIYMSMNTRFVG